MNKVEVSEIKNYIQNYFSEIFSENVTIEIKGNSYVLNKSLAFDIYDFWNKKDEELFDDFNDFSFNNDYIGTIFFFLSGYWEYNHYDIKDLKNRFPAEESFPFKKDVLEEPVVDILSEKIKNKLNLNYKENISKIFITHDIDFLGLPIKNLLADILKRKDINLFFDKITKKFTNNDPCSVENLIHIHKKYNSKGTFFFMPNIQEKQFYAGYDLKKNKKYFQKLENDILNIKSNIGIHYDTRYLNENRMKEDIDKLQNIFNSKIDSGRAHFLIFDIKKSFDIFEKSGIKLDSTGSYTDSIGFRFGTCKPFKPYNFNTGKSYNFYEYPLIIMEGSLQGKNYMNLNPEEGFEKIKEIMDTIKLYNGVFTFLWHNTSFYIDKWKEWEWVYQETIKYAKEKGFEFI